MAYQSFFSSNSSGGAQASGSSGGYKSYFGFNPVTTAQPTATQSAGSVATKAPAKSPSLFSKVVTDAKNLAVGTVKSTAKTGEKSLNTVMAGEAGLAGGVKAAAQGITGNSKGANKTISNTERVMNEKLDKGAGGVGGYISSKQAASSGGGKKGLINNFVKPVSQATADIAPLVAPVGKGVEGASLAIKAARGAVDNAAIGGGTTVANESVQGRLKDKKSAIETAKGVAESGLIGALAPVLHEGMKAGKDSVHVDPTDQANLKVNSLLDKNRQYDDTNPDGSLQRNTPTETTQLNPEYKPTNAKVQNLVNFKQRISEAQNAPIKQAEQQQANAAKTAQDNQVKVQKIDRQTELIQAKGKDSETGLSNVDKTKLGHLKEDKAQLASETPTAETTVGVTQPTESQPKVATEIPQTPVTASEKPVSASQAKSTPVTKEKAPVAPKTLTPVQTAHMPEIGGYTHSSHLEKDYADMLRGQEKDATVVTVQDGEGGYKRVSNHSKFFRDYYKANGKAPTIPDYLEEAKRHLMSGHDAFGASEDYKALLEREAKPIPRIEVNTTPIAGGGKVLTSKVGASVEEKAVKAKLTKSLGDLPQYSKVDMKQQARDASHLLENDQQKAIDIALGKESPPAHLLPESVYAAVENKALATKDIELLQALARSSRVGEATAMGQRIRALAEREPNSPVEAIRKVSEARTAAIEKKTGTTVTKLITQEAKVAKAEVPKITRETWGSFIDSLKC